MKEKLKKINERLAAIPGEQAKLLDSAGDAGLSEEAQKKFDALTQEFETLKKSAQQIKDAIGREEYLAEIDPEDRPLPGYNKKETDQFAKLSITAVFRAAANGEQLTGLEKEMAQEAQKEARESGLAVGGWAIPSAALSVHRFRADMTATGANQGAETISTDVSPNWITPLLARVVCRDLGATVLTGLRGNILIPTFADTADPAEKTENADADELTSVTGSVTLSPKRLPAFIDVSEQLLIQGNPSVEAYLRDFLLRKMATKIDRMAIHGQGAGSNQPVGILGTSGIGSVVGGAAGAAPDWADIVDLETAVAVANADVGRIAYLTNPKVRGKLKKTPVVSGTDSQMVWDRQTPEMPLNGYRAGVTTSVPSTLVKGGSGAVCSAIIFGNFEDLLLAQWGGWDVKRVIDKPNAIAGLVTLVVTAFYDSVVQRAASFAAMQDALTT